MDFSEDGKRLAQLGEKTMETMTVKYDQTEGMSCDPDKIHVSKYRTEDILLILHDDIVDDFDFAEHPKKAITFEDNNLARRFSQVRLNDKTLWLHDDNTQHHKDAEFAKFTVTRKEKASAPDKFESLDPQVINE